MEVKIILTFLEFMLFFQIITGHENENPLLGDQGHHHDDKHDEHVVINVEEQPAIKFDSSVVHNKKHIDEHLDGYAKKTDEMTEEELQFHYFKLHDSNGDNELDGIELMQAFLHEHKEEKDSPTPDDHADHHDTKPMNISFIVSNVDFLLETYDSNKNGLVSYPEFKTTINKHKSDHHQESPHSDQL